MQDLLIMQINVENNVVQKHSCTLAHTKQFKKAIVLNLTLNKYTKMQLVKQIEDCILRDHYMENGPGVFLAEMTRTPQY